MTLILFNVHKSYKAPFFNTDKASYYKGVTSHSPRDTWTNIGLDMIDIRTISSVLDHSSVDVTGKHHGQSIQEKILDEINHQISTSPKP